MLCDFLVIQVEFLCERGADVNRGQRSSSLHYAACFGRPAVAKVVIFPRPLICAMHHILEGYAIFFQKIFLAFLS